MWQARQKIVLVRKVPLPGSEMSRYPGRLLPLFAQDIKPFLCHYKVKRVSEKLVNYMFKVT